MPWMPSFEGRWVNTETGATAEPHDGGGGYLIDGDFVPTRNLPPDLMRLLNAGVTPEVRYLPNNAGPNAPNMFSVSGRVWGSLADLQAAYPDAGFVASDPRFLNPPPSEPSRGFLSDFANTFFTGEDAFLKIPPIQAALAAAYVPGILESMAGSGVADAPWGVNPQDLGQTPMWPDPASPLTTPGLVTPATPGWAPDIPDWLGTTAQVAGAGAAVASASGGGSWAATQAADDALVGGTAPTGTGPGGNVYSPTATGTPGTPGTPSPATTGGFTIPQGVKDIASVGSGAAAIANLIGLGDGYTTDPTAGWTQAADGTWLPPAEQDPGSLDVYGNSSVEEYGAPAAGSPDFDLIPRIAGGAQNVAKWVKDNPVLARMLGGVGSAALGAYASNRQAGALTDLANKYTEYGAPSRARYEASFAPGFDVMSMPGYAGALDSASNAILRRLSTQGNPFSNPGGLIEANKAIVGGTALPALNEYRRLNLAGGGLANLNAAVPSLETGSLQAGSNMWHALGSGISNVLNPSKTMSLADLAKLQLTLT